MTVASRTLPWCFQERSDLLGMNKTEMLALFDKRSKGEQDFLERYLSTVESYQQTLEALRVSDAEDYHILKIRLETDIQVLMSVDGGCPFAAEFGLFVDAPPDSTPSGGRTS